ncbi:hypothetical protein [Leuconostoc citreum]|uniref:hypothetical protein n=1 Tax=Leuconostoc citreum TaxID=33964 RepID=UPI0021A52FE0|nr:hypothetical protein [Leuconostoc citreum]MCT3076941.1 hypothetical protein [Leuconostoc citreum]
MTKTVAYLNKYLDHSTNITIHKPENQQLLSSKPLYTAEDLHQRVKMTQAEFDEWKEVFDDFDFFSEAMVHSVNRKNHIKLFENIYLSKNNSLSGQESESKFAKLWADFNPENPEETIEIVPDMKWFVRSKTSDKKYGYWYLRKTEHYFFHEYIKEISTQFDTKEEAELWKNPLTEAVQLPVEGE